MQELEILTNDYNLEQVHTPCRDCMFALVDYKTQYDCAMGMFERFDKNNISKVVVYDADNNEFFVINGIQCPGFRDEKWKRGADEKAQRLLSLVEYLDLVEKQNTLRFYIMIFVDTETTQEQVQFSINECLKNKYEHVKYVFVARPAQHNMVLSALRASSLDNWRTETLLEECKHDRAVDIAQKKTAEGYQYTGEYPAGSPIDFSLLHKISDTVYNFNHLALVYDGVGKIFYNRIYNMLGGNFDKTFVEKLKMVIEATKEDHLIKNGSEL